MSQKWLLAANPLQKVILTRPPVVIPDIFLVAIKLKLHPALFWFTDKRLRFAEENPGDLPTKKNLGISDDKALLDIVKLKTTLGSDDTTEGVSVLTGYKYINADALTAKVMTRKYICQVVLQ
ncbi:hypothetical protein B0H14DRAFT_2581941 [Mycena olivaceomarginata]|nr:hypothetical protein B0H14DRAFT_2581941 [Mycena olivaceomarginata]